MQYYGADGLGSVRQLYDASGQVLANNRYDPYGSVLSHSGEATSVFGFTGEQWDAATGLEYLRARYYSSAQGRFVTRDVWAGDPNSPMSYNAWLYAYGNSVNLTDPSGQCTGIAPWTDFVGGALSNSGVGLSAATGYLQAAAAAGQKAGENCAQNLSMASTRFQQGNYGSSLAYASGLLTSLNEAQGLLAEVNRGDYGTKARESFERGDYWKSLGYATRMPQGAEAGLGWYAGWFRDIDTATNNRFNRMLLDDPLRFWTRLSWEDLPELMEIAEADCRIGGTGLTIASFITPGVLAVKGRLMGGPAAGAKPVPNPGGRLGDATTRAKTGEVINNLRSRGFSEIRTEVRFRPANVSGTLGDRYADVVGRNPSTGATEIIQIGKATRNGVPVMRERLALDDIIFSPDIASYPGAVIRFVDKFRPGVMQP